MTEQAMFDRPNRNRRGSSTTVKALAALTVLLIGFTAIAAGWQPRGSLVTVNEPRLVVLKSKHVAHLFDGEKLVRSYPIDLGFVPLGQKLREGDGKTPFGRFRIATKNSDSPYHRFLGLDYPHEEAVKRGLQTGLVTRGEAARIRAALAAGRCPDWSTALGGGIGIHGHRRGRDWTAGCVAVADEHIEELFAVMRIGDPVEILP
ncbi:MAG: L,D-transpeptidase [Planctomycetes bacterium]|nr:L,D-transpeptidase [Planctomycetota bacterium]